MAGPYQNDSQTSSLPKRITLPTLNGKMGTYDKNKPPFLNTQNAGVSTPNQNASQVNWNPLTQRGAFGGGSTPVPNSMPVNYNAGLFPGGAGGGPSAPSVPGGTGWLGRVSTGIFNPNNPFASSMGGAVGAMLRMKQGLPFAGNGAGGGAGAGMDPEEAGYKSLADKYGIDWNVTKQVYMRSPRNPRFDPATAINLHLDDKAWGDAARAAGILTGNADYDNQVWIDHFNAGGNMNADPMAGHNYAQMAYAQNQQNIGTMVNGPNEPPKWL